MAIGHHHIFIADRLQSIPSRSYGLKEPGWECSTVGHYCCDMIKNILLRLP
jgi:hypothetical protein